MASVLSTDAPTRPLNDAGDERPSPTNVVSSRPHVATLDGVRGLAILLVILSHLPGSGVAHSSLDKALWRALSAGWVGVDLFFVLSGFLITGILLKSRGQPYYFRNFYIRRVLRIQPLYLLLIAATLTVLPLVGLVSADELARLRGWSGWFWLMVSNVPIGRHGFEATAPLQHLWSVAVEEQFYLVWPALVALASDGGVRRAAIGMIVLSPLVRAAMLLAGASGMMIHVMPFTRVDALAWGTLLAVTARQAPLSSGISRVLPVLAIGGAAVLVPPFVQHHFIGWQLPSVQLLGYSGIAAIAAFCVWTALGADRHSLLVRVFDASWLRFLGRYSYSLYLLHLFVMRGLERTPIAPNRVGTVGGHATPALALFAVATIAVSCLLALVSWRLVEGPALRLKRYFPTG